MVYVRDRQMSFAQAGTFILHREKRHLLPDKNQNLTMCSNFSRSGVCAHFAQLWKLELSLKHSNSFYNTVIVVFI